jgi:hypothetical protein
MNPLPKILVAMPTASAKDYCVEDFIDQIKNFTYPLYDIFIVDNSKDANHVELFWKNGIKAIHEPIKGDFREELARHQNIIREYFLNGNYDYLFMVESDVFTGEAIIDKLVGYAETYQAGAVTCTYEIMKGEPTLCLTTTSDLNNVRSEKMLPRSMGYNEMGKGCVSFKDFFKDPDANLTATGIGCTLFHREALLNTRFRVNLELNKNAFSDTFIFTDIEKLGYQCFIDSDILCEHRK